MRPFFFPASTTHAFFCRMRTFFSFDFITKTFLRLGRGAQQANTDQLKLQPGRLVFTNSLLTA